MLATGDGRCHHQGMKVFVASVFLCGIALALSHSAVGQTFARSPDSAMATQLEALSKKIDEQNTKIDMLSQQILKLEQQLQNKGPGVMIGEATPAAPAPPTAPAPAVETGSKANGTNTHTVARGETLTAIAKTHGVTVSELQKANQNENERKLQIGQTLVIPAAGTSPTPTPTSD